MTNLITTVFAKQSLANPVDLLNMIFLTLASKSIQKPEQHWNSSLVSFAFPASSLGLDEGQLQEYFQTFPETVRYL